MQSKATVVWECVPRVILDHSCTNLQPVWWRLSGVHVWWPGQGRGGPWGQTPGETSAGGCAPALQASWGRLLGSKVQGLTNLTLVSALGALCGKYPEAGLVPKSDLAPWVAKPLRAVLRPGWSNLWWWRTVSVRNSESKATGQGYWVKNTEVETVQREWRLAGTSGCPAHYSWSRARAENGFSNPWCVRHRVESQEAELQ
jgi:hypothetical protein